MIPSFHSPVFLNSCYGTQALPALPLWTTRAFTWSEKYSTFCQLAGCGSDLHS